MSNSNLGNLALCAIIGVVSGAGSAFITADSMLKEQPQIKLVDVKKITGAQILSIEKKFKEQGIVDPETISLFGQKAASEMFVAIKEVGGKDYILSKSNVINSPDTAEVTDDVAIRLGLDLNDAEMLEAINNLRLQSGK
ncbi:MULTISPECIES: hypothetical protein [Vibrio]|uniref:hypothetical protein n=1 Tax=Vibrio TaxID=662 RepID=UPI00078CD304|nr:MULTISPECIES: hypothetical protein [Vibrio]BAU70865.1 hypothetical protein [Vibrio sp. 04Ya108]BBM67566.1 hypothetical protein VA249_42120 [Vibrio alfacsensis]BCN27049.1 hypothetical protein VYA_42410 [Vibrio alfacsensis]